MLATFLRLECFRYLVKFPREIAIEENAS
jgi:hypothetical protein